MRDRIFASDNQLSIQRMYIYVYCAYLRMYIEITDEVHHMYDKYTLYIGSNR